MKLQSKTLTQLSKLARIEITLAEEKKLLSELNRIEALLSQVNALDIKKTTPGFSNFSSKPHLRKDQPGAVLPLEATERLAPDFSASHFVVPQVVE